MDALRRRRHVRPFGFTATLVILLACGGSTATLAADRLATVRFAVADEVLFEEPSIGTGFGAPGSWSFERGRMVNGRLELHVEITPVRQTLPVTSGPAVLFAGLSLYGDAGGDVGLGLSVAPIAHTLIPACDDRDCHYTTDISIPISRLPDAIASLERDGKLIWVSADLTLVRTFGVGEWLQVLAFRPGPGGIDDVPAGRLGAMEPTHGVLDWAGLFPADQALPVSTSNGNLAKLDYAQIVESLRSNAGDTSASLPAVDAALQVQFLPSCQSWTELTLHDDRGNHLFFADEIPAHSLINVATRMPIGSPWYLTLDAGEGVQQPLVRLGPIQPDGSGLPMDITATIDCSAKSGTLEMTGAATPSTHPTHIVASAKPPAPTSTPLITSARAGSASDSSTSMARSISAALAAALLSVGFLAAFIFRRRSHSS